ncbi:MAG: metallophosphoesterase [Blastocatellia bacterium]|nr:metallophosphoesterase [Blastocatellia bacterium]
MIFVDRNKNGRRDDGEEGIPGVVVSDQVQAVASGPDGRYRLENSRSYGIVFVSLPEGYSSVGPVWRRVPDGANNAGIDFPLTPAPAVADFTFVHASDTHTSETSLPRLRKLREIVASLRPAFVLVTGDLVRDALRVTEKEARSYYEMYLREIEQFPVPVWSVPGNHEIFAIERHKSLVSADHPLYGKKMYRHYLGPNYYSFNYGGVHFIGLDSVDYDDLWYYGHVDSTQLEWLKQDLSHVSKTTAIVTFNHIPFYTTAMSLWGYDEDLLAPTLITVNGKKQFRHSVSNAADILAVLKAHTYTLALGGHNHLREQIVYEMRGNRTRFHQTAAVVGPTAAPGIDFRSGVTLYRVRSGKIDDGEFIPLDGSR